MYTKSNNLLSWGRAHRFDQYLTQPLWQQELKPLIQKTYKNKKILTIGLGRSYGDVGLNQNQLLIQTTRMNRMLAFNRETGLVKVESGISIRELNQITSPQGWFVPVTPGTSQVTVGGAIANDVHGKNHHVAGTFGCHVPSFGLIRSKEGEIVCSDRENSELFSATIGGMGLTGLISWAEIQLQPIESYGMFTESIKFSHLSEFFEIVQDSAEWPYTVAWIDCFAPLGQLGRGLFSRACHVTSSDVPESLTLTKITNSEKKIAMPIEIPAWGMNKYFISLFNRFYYHRQRSQKTASVSHADSFFYPLDKIQNWNKLYGPDGFFQFQCVVPLENGAQSIQILLETIRHHGEGSFLAVLKEFGNIKSPGLLSFPKAGFTLALDFPNKGRKTIELFRVLHQITLDAGGRIYPAKDAHLTPQQFETCFPHWLRFESSIDDAFESSFYRRVLKQIVSR